MNKAHIDTLLAERERFIAAGLDKRVKQVEQELRRYDAMPDKPKAKPKAKPRAKAVTKGDD